MYNKKKRISRSNFLKTSTFAAGGLVLLPSTLISTLSCSANGAHNSDLKGYEIVIRGKQSSPIEKKAARKLREYLQKADLNLSIVNEETYQGNKGIYIGHTQYAEQLKVNFKQLDKDGYAFRSEGNDLIISGGSEKGILYGVYSLLEMLGFRKYDAESTYIPTSDAIRIPESNTVVVPQMNYRETSYYGNDDGDIMDWHKLDSKEDSWGMFVHTYLNLIPPEKYAETHPEYYSLIDGSRNPNTQLCLSNDEVFEVVVENLRKKMVQKPNALYWSVSQEDNDQYCQCGPCTRLNKKYGGTRPNLEHGVPSGSVVWFANKVAEEFPDKIISTLAYWYTRDAPDNIKAKSNVNIMLAPIGPQRQKPIFETAPDFTNDLKKWGRISNSILIWDYYIQFANSVSPFPNLHTIKPNIKFYRENNVDALFMQATHQAGSEMASLRSYLIAKLMWDPEADDEAIINEFTDGYYGDAGSYIRQYIDKMREEVLESNYELELFGSPITAKDAHLSFDLMEEYRQLFNEAEKAVEVDPELVKRVRIARLPIMFAQIQIGRTEIDTPRSMFKHNKNGRIVPRPEMKTLVHEFVEHCKQYGVTQIRERTTTIDEYSAAYNRIFDKMDEMEHAISLHKKVIPITKSSKKSKGVQALTDGVFGSDESWRFPDTIGVNWVGYEGEHMEFVLDLGEMKSIKSVNMDFFNAQAQPKWHQLVLPKFVEYAFSDDGENYGDAVKIDNPHDPNPDKNPGITNIRVQSFHADLNSKQARYIKVHAESLLEMPSWHIKAGSPAKIYSDEIVVM